MVKNPSPPITQLSLLDPRLNALLPDAARSAVQAVWAYDRACAMALQQSREAPLQVIRLVWWRDAITGLGIGQPVDPVLLALRDAVVRRVDAAELVALADCWADFAEADLSLDAVQHFANARGRLLFAWTARLCGADEASSGQSCWAMVDTALHLSDPVLAKCLFDTAAAMPRARPSLAALTALDRLAHSVAAHGGKRRPLAEQYLLLRTLLTQR